MNLIPMPKMVKKEAGCFLHNTAKVVTEIADRRIKNALCKLPLSNDGAPMEIYINAADGEAYTLKIEKNKILLMAEGLKGAFYGIQTLRQLFTNNQIPCLYIEDKPDFGCRGFHLDITRGKIPKVKTIKKLIDDMAYYKLNTLELYSEHVFEFKEFKNIIRRTGCITAEEIREIEEYCHENFIEFIPAVAAFGHLYELLNEAEYKELRILKDYKPTNIFWDERAYHHTLDPLNPKSFALVKSILDQCMEMFHSDTINICCDETFDLENHKAENTGKLYTDFVKRIADYLALKGKKTMMWSDVILENIDIIAELPRDIELLTWGYGKRLREDSIQLISELKRPQIVCPGCNTWTRMIENTDVSEVNIPGMAELGDKYGAIGVMNTSWGDWGNACSIELSMYGFILGAEKSWSVRTKIDDDFRSRVNFLMYQSENGVEELKTLSALATAVPYWQFGAYYSNCVCENGNLKVEFPSEEVLRKVQKDSSDFIHRVSGQQWGYEECREEMLIVAEGTQLMAEIFAKIAGYSMERTIDGGQWFAKYRNKWLEKNKESELHEIEKMFQFMDKIRSDGGRRI